MFETIPARKSFGHNDSSLPIRACRAAALPSSRRRGSWSDWNAHHAFLFSCGWLRPWSRAGCLVLIVLSEDSHGRGGPGEAHTLVTRVHQAAADPASSSGRAAPTDTSIPAILSIAYPSIPACSAGAARSAVPRPVRPESGAALAGDEPIGWGVVRAGERAGGFSNGVAQGEAGRYD